jgi:hypothetical protein
LRICGSREKEGGGKMNYKAFYLIIQRYANKKISRGLFELEWKWEQKAQGITPQRGRFVRPGAGA